MEHPAGYEDSLPVWDARGKPVVDIGGGDDPGQELHLVRGAVRLSDGRIVVANGGTAELKVFDGTGKYLHAIGRKGGGPGEFGSLGTVWRLPGDTLVAYDGHDARFSLFAGSGVFLSSTAGLVRLERGSVGASMRMRDGRLLGARTEFGDLTDPTGSIRRPPFSIVIMAPGADRFDTLVTVPGPEIYPFKGSEGGQEIASFRFPEFGRTTVFTTDGTRIYVGSNEAVGIRVYESGGRLVRIIRSATPAEPVTQAHRDQRVRENTARIQRSSGSEQVKAEWRKNEEGPRFAEVFPSYERLLIAGDGSLWVERARRTEDEGRRFIVYDSAGKAIATVKCPDRVRPYEVGPTEIIGLWRDPDEVNHVRVYRVSGKQ